MSESVSRKNFLNLLDGVDYYKFGNISADWESINSECEQFVEQHPDHWCSLIPDESFEVWGEEGAAYKKHLQRYVKWGYNSQNTRSWTTTSCSPVLEMSWEESIREYFPLDNTLSRPTLQKPGNVFPHHEDKFFYIRHKYPDSKDYIVRFIVFHHDWAPGHLIQAGDSIISHWKQGDVIVWYPSRVHISCNVGFTDKWTTNVTGILKGSVELNK